MSVNTIALSKSGYKKMQKRIKDLKTQLKENQELVELMIKYNIGRGPRIGKVYLQDLSKRNQEILKIKKNA